MAWYNSNGNNNDVVLSSRVRLARNIRKYPFAPMLDETGASEIISKVKSVLSNYEMIDMRSKNHIERRSYVEKHFISPEFAASASPCALFLDNEQDNAVMVCEEDHLRIQSIQSGLALKKAFASACEIDDRLDQSIDYAYDEKLGYITHCPTNLGTGMRASVMMFLPALTMSGLLNGYTSQLEKLGLTLRGMYGEGSNAQAYIYQISNSITMGITEDETISKLENIVDQLIDNERKAREKLKERSYDPLCDKVSRAYGIMKSAYIMSSSEFMKLFADVKLGADLGILTGISDSALSELLVSVMPATLMLAMGESSQNDTMRDKARAQFIKKYDFK